MAAPMQQMAGLLKAVPQKFAYALSALIEAGDGSPDVGSAEEVEADTASDESEEVEADTATDEEIETEDTKDAGESSDEEEK